MTFLTPAFLGALALIGIPLLIHLIRQRKLKIVKWAAMEFLRQSQKKQRKRLRIEELILLLLRMLIVALAALAFARPVLRALGVPLLSQNTHVYAVSCWTTPSVWTRGAPTASAAFERAKAAATEVVTKCPAGWRLGLPGAPFRQTGSDCGCAQLRPRADPAAYCGRAPWGTG